LKQRQWLSHLETSMFDSKYSKRISTYLIALEAWRRGIILQFHKFNPKSARIHYSLNYKGRKHLFHVSKSDTITDEAVHICDDKSLTKTYLSRTNTPVPKGKKFNEVDPDNSIVEYAESIGYPVVLKAIRDAGGKGFFSNIINKQELKETIFHVRQERKYKTVLLEEHIQGKNCRVFVFNGEVIGALQRMAANIIGDGKSNIKELIEQKNKLKRKNPYTAKRMIKIDSEVTKMIARKNYTLESIPKKNEKIFLREKNSVAKGGDSIDITDQLSSYAKEVAIKAVHSIPGLIQGGIDIIVDENNEVRSVLEINEQPEIGGHLFPEKGKARDIATVIIDYYFPETIGTKRAASFFNFDRILTPLKDNIMNTVEVSPAQIGVMYSSKYIVSGKVQKVGYRKWIKNRALKQNLNGFDKNLKNGKVIVVVAGTDEEQVIQFKKYCSIGPAKANVESVNRKNWDKIVKAGFEVI